MFKWFWTIFSLGAPENKIVCLLLKYLLPWLVNLEVFFLTFWKKKMGRWGDGKQNILLGGPT